MLTLRAFGLALLLGSPALAQAVAPPDPSAPAPAPAPAPPPESESTEPDAPPPAPETVAPRSETDDVFAAVESELERGTPSATAEAPNVRPVGGASAFNPELSFVADFTAAAFSDAEHLQSGEHDPAVTGFNLQALELNARSVVDPYFRFDANLVFSLEGVDLEEAYATTTGLPAGFQARFGKFLSKFGRINASHPHAWDFVDQPFALGRVFGGEGNTSPGVELSALVPLPWYTELSGAALQATGEESARSFYGEEEPAVESPADLLYVTALKQFFDLSEDWSLLFGLSGAFGPNANGESHRTAVYGTDLYLKYRPITEASYVTLAWQSELLHRRRHAQGTVLWDFGGYSQLALRFARRWSAAARYDYGSPSYDLGGDVAEDPLDPEWTGHRHRVSTSLTHHPSEFSRLRLQGSRDMPEWRDAIWAVFLAAEVVIGAHGSHPF